VGGRDVGFSSFSSVEVVAFSRLLTTPPWAEKKREALQIHIIQLFSFQKQMIIEKVHPYFPSSRLSPADYAQM
jgi:hypothetical protein